MLEKYNLKHDLLQKYEKDAKESFDERFVSRELILKNASEAELSEEHKKLIADFLDFADYDLKNYIWLYYYIQFKTEETFIDNIWRLDEIPKPREAEEIFPGCINSVTYLLAAENLREWTEKNNQPPEMMDTYYQKYRNFVNLNMISHKTPAFCRLSPFLYGYAKPFIIQIGRLVYQLTPFKGYSEMYENKKGERLFVAMPNFSYNEKGLQEAEGFTPLYKKDGNTLMGHVFKKDGTLSIEPESIALNEYSLVYKPGDMMASIHIPSDGRLTKESVKESITMAVDIFKKLIYPIKDIVCTTWFLDPALRGEVIKEGSNLAAFADVFDIICGEDNNNHSIFEHVFKTYRRPLEELIPENSFQERILERAKRGEKIYWSFGVVKKGYLSE